MLLSTKKVFDKKCSTGGDELEHFKLMSLERLEQRKKYYENIIENYDGDGLPTYQTFIFTIERLNAVNEIIKEKRSVND